LLPAIRPADFLVALARVQVAVALARVLVEERSSLWALLFTQVASAFANTLAALQEGL
jgi:hypothetical protein